MANFSGCGLSVLQSLFFLSTAFVVVGQLVHVSGAELKVFDSILKCVAWVHHWAQFLAAVQSQLLSTNCASSVLQIEGTLFKSSTIVRTPQSASKQAITWTGLSNVECALQCFQTHFVPLTYLVIVILSQQLAGKIVTSEPCTLSVVALPFLFQ